MLPVIQRATQRVVLINCEMSIEACVVIRVPIRIPKAALAVFAHDIDGLASVLCQVPIVYFKVVVPLVNKRAIVLAKE